MTATYEPHKRLRIIGAQHFFESFSLDQELRQDFAKAAEVKREMEDLLSHEDAAAREPLTCHSAGL